MVKLIKMNDYKVCILAAGVGGRMGDFTKYFNKALIPVNGKPAICHIIEKVPEGVEIVIAVGYKKEEVISYLKSAYPKRKFIFVDVGKYEGEGSGPGYSLLQCKNYLQSPFIYESADTLFRENLPFPDKNWFGVVEVLNTERFCSVKVEEGKIVRIEDKIKTSNKLAFIGLAGVYDYEHFWNSLEKNKRLVENEIQVSNGFISLIEKGLYPINFTWFDTGTPKAYSYTLENYPNGPSYGGE